MNENINPHDLLLEIESLRKELHDLTQAHDDLLIHKQQLNAILDNIPLDVSLKDREGRYIRVNKQFEKLYGVKNEDLIGLLPTDVHDPKLAASSRDHDLAVLNSGEGRWREEIGVLGNENQSHTLSTIKFPVFDDDGAVDGLGAIVTDISESAVTKEQLRKSNVLFSQAEQLGNIGHWEWDEISSRYITCSEGYASFFDMSVEQLIEELISAESNHELVCKDDRERYKQVVGVAFENKHGWDIEYACDNGAGKRIYLHEIGELVLDDNGVIIGTLGTIQDITAEKDKELAMIQATEAAQAVNRQLVFQTHALDEHAIVSIADIAGDITYVNDKFCAISGYDREELIGNNHKIVKSDEHSDAYFVDMWTTISSGHTWHGEIKNNNKTGDDYWVKTTIVPTLDDKGKPFQYVGIRTEITEDKKRESKIAEAQAELNFQKHALDEHAIVSIADIAGDITYVNDKFCAISGYDREELIGNNHKIVKSDEHSKDFYIDLWKTISSGVTWHGEIKNEIKGGGYYWVNATIVPTLDDRGKPIQYVAIRNDITDEKDKEFALIEATEAAQEANLTKSQFLAAMSHEIRTPMAGIIGMSDLLLDTDLSPQQLDWANSIKSSGNNLLTILNEILDQSKLEAGKLEISPTAFHLPSFVRDNVNLFGPSIASKGLALDIKVGDDLPESIHADPTRIGQVLSNLLSNALKFTSTGRIEVAVKPEPNEQDELQIRFTVTDNGIGLNDEEKSKLFTAFTQADSSTSRDYGGTGLGLSISKQLVELMGGQIGVESAKGIGSAFWFTVCYQPTKEAVVATDRRVALDRWVAARPLKILVAEDNAVNQHMIRAILKKLNHSIEIAEDGKCAIEFLNSGDFDLILMDIRMPVMDGLEATASIRTMGGPKSNIPIIALTADISAGNITEYTDVGMNDVCGKPINLPVLLKSINKCLGEEIHTSLSQANASETSQQPVEAAGSNTEKSDEITNFDQVLLRVASIVEQTAEQDKDTETPPEMAAAIGEDAFAELLAMYVAGLKEQCDGFTEAISDLSNKPTDSHFKAKAIELTQTIKGGGGSFGYHLITTIATHADHLLKESKILTSENIELLSNYAKALELISVKKMSGYGGKAGRILLQALERAS